jgi:osmotically inducible protein OsmC
MPIRNAEAEWNGSIIDGKGHMKLGSGAFDGPYSFRSRMEEGPGTNPEELIGAAHAGCYSMALSAILGRAGLTPTRIHTKAAVKFEKVEGGFSITNIELTVEAEIPGTDAAAFEQFAETAKANCPVSRALAGTHITLRSTLL